MTISKRKVLVTGATRQIGGELIRLLANDGSLGGRFDLGPHGADRAQRPATNRRRVVPLACGCLNLIASIFHTHERT
jgi:NAD(P)-dependent dehydrogenase (short-subunit alcohol dehydrogenase family)